MKTAKAHRFLLGLLACASLAGILPAARGSSYSLAGDFSYTENSATSLWSFRLDDYANNPPTFLPLLTSTTLTANDAWGTDFATPPQVWSEGSGYWGIGKNTTGGPLHATSGGGIDWAPNEVLLHPKGGGSPARLVICWRAPKSMIANIHTSLRKAMPCGNGVGYELRTRIGGVDTEVIGFGAGNIGAGIARDHDGISFGAGDQLFLRVDTWGDAGCDITGVAMEISEALPTSFSLAGDFTYAENSTNSLWSFRMDDFANNPPTFLPLLTATNLTANDLWGTDFPTPPAAWSEGTGYWGIAKNTSGTNLHATSSGGIDWAANEVLLHPKGGGSPARLVIGWRAPRSLIVNVHTSLRKAMGCGNGVGYELRTRIGGVDTEVIGFGAGNIGSGVTRDHGGLSFGAGDQLFLRIDTWGDAGCDLTGVAMEIVEAIGPPTIGVNPVGGTVPEGGTFILSVSATNASGYAWYKGTDLIPGVGGASYSLIDAGPSAAGTYRVVATNASQSVTSAPAVVTFSARPTYSTVLLNEDFHGYSGNQNNLQYQTGLKVSHTGTVPGWNRAGGGAIHAVDRTGTGNYAAMIWQDNVLTLANGIPANETSATYHLDFVIAPATYSDVSQTSAETDGIVVEVLRGDFSVLASSTNYPGAWGTQGFRAFSFAYSGDGSGPVMVRISPLIASGHFSGEIDNLRVATDFVPSIPPIISAEPTGGSVEAGSDFTFSVVASGVPTYQWFKGGLPIAGATGPSYSIIDVRTDHAATYTVVLTNAAGAVTSAPVVLTVTGGGTPASYLAAVLTDNPIHYYPLDDTNGTVAADLGSLALGGGSYSNGFTLVQPSVNASLGTSVRFDGAPGTLVDLGVFHPGDTISVEAWFKIDPDARVGWNAVVGRWDGSYEVASHSDLGISFAVRNDANAVGQVFSATVPTRGVWHHVVAVFSGGTLTVYVDGVQGGTQTIGGVLQNAGPTPDRAMIGSTRDGTGSSAFNVKGQIDEVAIYDTALTLLQVRAHFHAAQTAASQSLTVHRTSEGAVVLSWPSFSPGYVLQSASQVNGPFQNYAGSLQVQDDHLTAQVAADSAQKFFRLLKP